MEHKTTERRESDLIRYIQTRGYQREYNIESSVILSREMKAIREASEYVWKV